MSCENCDCAENNDVRALKRRLDELERIQGLQGQGIIKVTKLIDTVSLDLKRRYVELETELTYHTDSPHNTQELLFK